MSLVVMLIFAIIPYSICVVDPENSVFYDYYKTGNKDVTSSKPSMIEGIGRPRVEASLCPNIIDKMINVPDAASLAGTPTNNFAILLPA